ncbi:hypothetical protein [Phaeocystidibacter luteus]|uniref:Uncharacterized protein n=1 Tax=Phaeocystidibacter luteus TaxID=911197 RepID=A0A6N6RIZ0_9FLAO|nr:hypothetical protein [Phaeocystidibacter luteus]KAB2813936.1 hypothetical protein F8C67_04420 [Phaeocystidibacter luteus]
MSKMLLLMGAVCLLSTTHAQICDFDGPNWAYQLSGNGTATISSSSPYSPTGATFGIENSNGLAASGGSVLLTLDTISTIPSHGSLFTFKLGANALSGSGRGMDASSDYVVVRVGTSVSTLTEVLRIKGYSNAQWDINSVHQNLIVDAQSTTVASPYEGGEIKYGAPGTVTLFNLPSDSAVVFQVEMHSDRTNEVWSVDDLALITPKYWDGVTWSNGGSLAQSDYVLLNDTLGFPSGAHACAGVIASSSGTTLFQNKALTTGTWIQLAGNLAVDSGLTLTDSLGSGQLFIKNGMVLGSLSMERRALSSGGWRHLSVPVRTTYGDLSEDLTQVNYGPSASPSIFAWDAGNSSWYSFYDGTSITKHQPVVLFGGQGWIDSTNRMKVSGEIAPIVDTIWLDYSTPTAQSPFAVSVGNEGWNFIGNPYPFPLDLELLLSDADLPTLLAPTAYLWSTEEQQYRSYNVASGAIGSATPVVAPWQGFWMQFDSNPGGLQPLYIKQSHRALPEGDQLRKSSVSTHDFVVRSDSGEVRLVVADMPGGDVRWDYQRDHKQKNSGVLSANLVGFSGRDEFPLSLKVLDKGHKGGIPLEVKVDKYTVVEIALESDQQWWLEDISTGKWVNLLKSSHKVLASPNGKSRFRLWRRKALTREVSVEHERCEVPVHEKGIITNSSGLTWELYTASGAHLLSIAPGETVAYYNLSGLYFWKCGECVEKVYYSGNP